MSDSIATGVALALPLAGLLTVKAVEIVKGFQPATDLPSRKHRLSENSDDDMAQEKQVDVRNKKNDMDFFKKAQKKMLLHTAPLSREEIMERRSRLYGPSCQMFFKQDPIKITRAAGQYMYDDKENRFIDCINNVAHVGHCHPYVVEAMHEQMKLLYTNNRYLHDNLVNLAERLTQTMPGDLSVCYFTNSGSEANDLALQLARKYTQQTDVITVDNAYHGTTTALVEIGTYKWKQMDSETSAIYQKSWSHSVASPDAYRGKFRSEDFTDEQLGELYANEVKEIINKLAKEGKAPAAFIAESMQSCGGQIIFPKDYMLNVKKIMEKCGGLTIADEVQVGFGRVGDHMWAFQQYGPDFIPDIVTIGKPMGNGHPVAAVITTKKVADRFTLSYFNTYGGNPVSCAAALAVLDVIKAENLQLHAKVVGGHLHQRLLELQQRHTLIGDVRGVGLFQGAELVLDRTTKEPATDAAGYIIGVLRNDGVLLSRDGPDANVLKFKPPMCITEEDLDTVCDKLDLIITDVERDLKMSPRSSKPSSRESSVSR